jgi:hypothetical protein
MINARARLLGPHRYHLPPTESVVINEHRSNLPYDNDTISEQLSPRQLFKITTFQLPLRKKPLDEFNKNCLKVYFCL